MDFELKTLLDDFGFSAEERAQAEALLTPKLDKVKSRFMAQADYSRGKDQLAKENLELEKKELSLDSEFARIAQYEKNLGHAMGVEDVTQVAPALKRMIEDMTAHQARVTKLEADLKKYGEDYGFTPDLTPPKTPPVHSTTRPNGGADLDTARFLTHEQFNQEVAAYPFLAAELHDLGVKHQQLFGSPLGDTTAIVKAALDSAREAEKYKDPGRLKKIDQVWEEKYNVAQKRTEIAKAAEDTRVEQRVQEELTKRASQQHSSPIPNAGLPGSPALSRKFEPVVKDAQIAARPSVASERRGVDAALEKFGTYYGGQSQ